MSHNLVLLRRKHALTQTELARLIGVSQTTAARLEDADLSAYNIRLEWALALQVVFGKSPISLFRKHFDEIEDAVIGRASELDRALDGRNDQASAHKRALLSDMMRRATTPRTP